MVDKCGPHLGRSTRPVPGSACDVQRADPASRAPRSPPVRPRQNSASVSAFCTTQRYLPEHPLVGTSGRRVMRGALWDIYGLADEVTGGPARVPESGTPA